MRAYGGLRRRFLGARLEVGHITSVSAHSPVLSHILLTARGSGKGSLALWPEEKGQ